MLKVIFFGLRLGPVWVPSGSRLGPVTPVSSQPRPRMKFPQKECIFPSVMVRSWCCHTIQLAMTPPPNCSTASHPKGLASPKNYLDFFSLSPAQYPGRKVKGPRLVQQPASSGCCLVRLRGRPVYPDPGGLPCSIELVFCATC